MQPMKILSAAFAAGLAFAASPAHADEIFTGVYAHDVDTPLNLRGYNEGVDVQVGWRGDRIEALSAIGSPQPYAFAAVNTAGDMHYAAVGVSWKIGREVYLRPGIGIALHTGDVRPRLPDVDRALGSRVLFEPELAVGVQVSERLSVEASWVHMSHATLFSGHNPGIDNVGLRVNFGF